MKNNPGYIERQAKKELEQTCECGDKKHESANMCMICFNELARETKIDWPKDSLLLDMLKTSSMVQVGKKLGVSDNAVKKRLKRKGLFTSKRKPKIS